ncbi:MAG TPA: long-chain-fatty-acid--CoA ligase [Burkholderiaceae bacterium]|nr:long-chain-fatty-acid--CoA ligase [Burkholderiaceae bacterium]
MFDRHFAHWPPGTPRTLTIPATSLVHNLQVSAARYPDKTAVAYYGASLTYAALAREVEALAGWLQRVAGVRRGDRVVLDLQNSPQFTIGYYAILRADAAVVPVNPMLKAEELRYLCGDSGARVAIVGQELLDAWRGLLGDSVDRVVVAAYADHLPSVPDPALAGIPVPDAVLAPRRPIEAADAARGATAWSDAVAAGHAPAPPLAGPDDIAVLPYTSGTTGHPKGCVHTHRTVMSTAVANCAWSGVTADAVQLSVLPMFHVTGMQGGMNGPIWAGATVVTMSRWDREACARLVERCRITSITGITTMIVDFLNTPGLAERDLSSLLRVGGGGAAMPDAVARRLEELLGLPFIEGYGLTETIAPTHINPVHRPKRQCAGIPIFNTDARVLDVETGVERGPNETGEIVVSGPQVFRGYWGRPEADEAVFFELDGKRFFRTGDLGHYDEDGYFFITDRLKRMINASGFKVWPAEVEAMLYAHPDVSEACVIASRDAHRGETVKAVVVPKAHVRERIATDAGAAAMADEIVAWSRERMAAYKVPRRVEFVEALPKTGTGKVFWRMLQEAEDKKWT